MALVKQIKIDNKKLTGFLVLMVLTTIYALACSETVWYVGSTKNPKIRERQHRLGNEHTTSKNIPKDVVWEFVILEQSEMDYWLRKDTEAFYIQFLEPQCNKQMPGRSDKESCKIWRAANQDRFNENHRNWRAANRDSVNETKRRWRAAKNLIPT